MNKKRCVTVLKRRRNFIETAINAWESDNLKALTMYQEELRALNIAIPLIMDIDDERDLERQIRIDKLARARLGV